MGRGKVPMKGENVDTPDGPAPTSETLEDGQHKDHWVLSRAELDKGFTRPVRTSYLHEECGAVTTMPLPIAQTYAADPTFYGSTFCCKCRQYLPVSEFFWIDKFGNTLEERVGS